MEHSATTATTLQVSCFLSLRDHLAAAFLSHHAHQLHLHRRPLVSVPAPDATVLLRCEL